MNSRFGIILAIIIATTGIILFTNKKDSDVITDENGNTITVEATNHTKGDGGKGVTIVEYGDFQCPACAAYYPIVEQVVEKYKADVTFQYRHFPLSQIHNHAVLAHRSAEAAANQGKFWEMYGLLYENVSTWTNITDAEPIFQSYAQSLGLNMDTYNADVKSAQTNAVVNKDIEAGKALGVTGTPSFFIDGKRIENPADQAAFEKLVEDAIAAKSQSN